METKEKVGSFSIIEGDLIQLAIGGKFDVIAHGCNCFSTMGAGIAKKIRQFFPEAYLVDRYSTMFHKEKMGNLTSTFTKEEKGVFQRASVFNLYTQYEPGANFKIEYLQSSLNRMARELRKYKHLKIGLPLIGCGIGGGDWEEVEAVILEELKGFNVTVVKYKEN